MDNTFTEYLEQLTKTGAPPEPNPAFQARMERLAEKANEGVLSPAEAEEYDRYVQLLDAVTLARLKAPARN